MKAHSCWRSLAVKLAALVLPSVLGCDSGGPAEPDPQPLGGLALQLVAQGLASPVALAEPPDGSGRLFIADQVGRIRIVDANGQLLTEPFLDLASRMVTLNPGGDERGFLGLAFHPSYATNRRFYVYYSAPARAGIPSGWSHTSHVSEFQASSDPLRATLASERIVLQVDQPQANHNGGGIAFGPDGFLYVSLGDGGGANDLGVGHVTGGNGQNPTNLLGSMLRIDVNGPAPYAIPPTNPFVGRSDGRGEVWAYGFRNPFRFSFDRQTGDLLVGDVGQSRWEEVSRVVRGGNYGWNRREGAHCFDAGAPGQQPATCSLTGALGEPLLDPVIEYANSGQSGGLGISVIGGYVYRGSRIPALVGHYVFGDFSRSFQSPAGSAWMAAPSASGLWSFVPLPFGDRTPGAVGHFLKGFGEDRSGEMYFLTSDVGGPTGSSGRIYRLVSQTP